METNNNLSAISNRFFKENLVLSAIFILLFAFGLPFKAFFVLNLLFLFIVYLIFFLLFFFSSKGIFSHRTSNFFNNLWSLLFFSLSIMMLFLLTSNTIWRFASYLIGNKIQLSSGGILVSVFMFFSFNFLYLVWFFRVIKYGCLFTPILWRWEKFFKIKFFNEKMLKMWCFENLKEIFAEIMDGIFQTKKYKPVRYANFSEICESEVFFSFNELLKKIKKIYKKRKHPNLSVIIEETIERNPFIKETLFLEDF